eukprot:CAMPEP_0113937282 /NCGR_PEP_ID=MMETSP1339-20121228/3936_1 /TAXON_ID=94617 /ORGANISM="Fibrocapsa japonica" /LENGTH=551 /DNA_ID=CAMNT_0000939987 /DNA_START=116 /DNA_END=1771 /DNA_ORIENTATION=- /assembly_acc=CAM_ASM_000762
MTLTETSTTSVESAEFQGRPLGNFEKYLSGTRRESENVVISHLSLAVVSDTTDSLVSEISLLETLEAVMNRHCLLRSCVSGEGKPELEPAPMVRIGDLDPPTWVPAPLGAKGLAPKVLQTIQVDGSDEEAFQAAWQKEFVWQLDNASYNKKTGPLWRLTWLPQAGAQRHALLFAFNHAISDQISANMILDEVLTSLSSSKSKTAALAEAFGPAPNNGQLPPSVEETVGAGGLQLGTARYALIQTINGAKGVTLLPDRIKKRLSQKEAEIKELKKEQPELAEEELPAIVPEEYLSKNRNTFIELATLKASKLAALRDLCRREGVTVSAALAAASLMATSDVAHDTTTTTTTRGSPKSQLYKFLLSVDLRRFGDSSGADWTKGAVACAGGAVDFVVPVTEKAASEFLHGDSTQMKGFWDLARTCRKEALEFIGTNFVRETVAMFDWGMKYVDIGEIMNDEADSKKALGRLFTCGVSNMGVYKGHDYGSINLEKIHYATSHTITGTLYQLSCGTVNSELHLTFQFTEPLVTRQEGKEFCEKFCAIIDSVSDSKN